MRFRSAAAAIALLAMVWMENLDGFAAHTDDGCKVEHHCVACRWAYSSTVAPYSPPVVASRALEPAGHVVVHAPASVIDRPLAAVSSRGPPAA